MLKVPSKASMQRWVPVVSSSDKPLMPCSPVRARKLLKKGKATKHFYRHLFYVKLTDREDGEVQTIAVGIDPGSMREGFTVMTSKRTLLNIQLHAADGKGVKKKVATRAVVRGSRRQKNTPYRQCRPNRAKSKNWVPPSTQARWQLKYNMVKALNRLYPITHIAIEDVKTETKEGEKRRNRNFSPIQAGKNWLYRKLETDNYIVTKFTGTDTFRLRKELGLVKTKDKLAAVHSAHCIDSWVIANSITGNRSTVDLTALIEVIPRKVYRRQLYRFNTTKGAKRVRYGGTMSLGIKRGTLVTHPKYGKCLVGGNNGTDRVSLHASLSNSILCRNAKIEDLTMIAHSPWLTIDHLTSNKEHKILLRQHRLCTKLSMLNLNEERVHLTRTLI